MKINCKVDCTNAPKMEFVKTLTVHFVAYEIEEAMQYMDKNMVWTLVGDSPLVGREKFKTALTEMSQNKARALTIRSIITHGKEASVHGDIEMEDGAIFGFADFYVFTSVKAISVKSIRSYIVQM